MNEPSPSPTTGRLRPIYARGLFLAGLVGALLPLSRRAPRAQGIVLELPSRLRGAQGTVEVAYTRAGEPEPLGGYTLSFPNGAPGTVRREISAPDGRYRLDISLEFTPRSPGIGAGIAARNERNEIDRQVSFTGSDIRVILEDAP